MEQCSTFKHTHTHTHTQNDVTDIGSSNLEIMAILRTLSVVSKDTNRDL
jgi:hypothetical protein